MIEGQMKILLINGPNLNMLGKRKASIYGSQTLSEIERRIQDKADSTGVAIELFQSNHEGAIIDYLQEFASEADGIVINPGALTHYGLSVRDALTDSRLPIVEVHLSNIHSREEFRRDSVIAPIAIGQIVGLGWRGYLFAVEFLVSYINEHAGS